MSTLIIRKKSLKTWLHTDSVLGNFIISKFYFSADDNSFQIVEQGQSKRIIYNVADITLYDEPNGGGAETFTTITALSLRLEQLNYPAFQYDGQITSIANLIAEGTNITITGDGTEASPYVISATGGGFGTPKLSEVLAEENITDGNNIVISDGDAIELENLSKLQQGTVDNGFGGGISQICTAEKEQQWENGVRYLREVGGTNVFAETLDDIIPDNSYDNTKNWAVDSYFKNLVTQKLYKCTDATTGSAVWEEQASSSQTLQQVMDEGDSATIANDNNTNTFSLLEELDGGGFLLKSQSNASAGIGTIIYGEEALLQISQSIEGKSAGAQMINGSLHLIQSNSDGSEVTTVNFEEPTANTTWSVPAKSAGSYDFASTDDIPTITGLVPYTGATADVNLGNNDLYVTKVWLYDESNDNYGSLHFTDSDFHIEDADGHKMLVIEDGFIQLHKTDTIQSNLYTSGLSATRDHYLPNESGTIALTSIVADNITNGVTDKAPSQNAVFDALAENVEKAILKDNAFWVSPNSTLAGNSLVYSPIVTGNFALQGNTTGNSGMTLFATTASAGTLAFKRRHDAFVFQTLEIEFTQKIRFQTNISGQRFFHGLTKGNQFSAPTNVDPSTLTDIVGVCQLSSSTNMHVIHNDSSGTATTIDLGSNYPCNTNIYNYFITIQQTTTSYIVTVERVTVATGARISETRTLTTNIMNYATGVIQVCTWITNNATASIASYLDGGLYGTFKN